MLCALLVTLGAYPIRIVCSPAAVPDGPGLRLLYFPRVCHSAIIPDSLHPGQQRIIPSPARPRLSAPLHPRYAIIFTLTFLLPLQAKTPSAPSALLTPLPLLQTVDSLRLTFAFFTPNSVNRRFLPQCISNYDPTTDPKPLRRKSHVIRRSNRTRSLSRARLVDQ